MLDAIKKLMSAKRISEKEYYSFNVPNSPMTSFIGEERYWFHDAENNLLGTIILDNFDHDWGYVILALDSDGEYRAIKFNSSLETEEHAEHELIVKLAELGAAGEFREDLYEQKSKDVKVSITDINEEIKIYFRAHPDKLYDLSPRKFEELVASILEDFGFTVELTKATRDGGSDIIAFIRNAISTFLLLVECKKYSKENKVGVGIIRNVVGVHTLKKPSKSIIVTTSFFTQEAKKEAELFKEQLELKDYNDIKTWLKNY